MFTCVSELAETRPKRVPIMIGQGIAALQQTGAKRAIYDAAANLADRDAFGTMILDGMGRIRSCGAAGERIFGVSQVRLIGRRISDFVAGLSLGGSSPSYSARYFMYLCADREWRRLKAVDADGHEFPVDLNLSRLMTDGQEIFVLNLRRVEESNGA